MPKIKTIEDIEILVDPDIKEKASEYSWRITLNGIMANHKVNGKFTTTELKQLIFPETTRNIYAFKNNNIFDYRKTNLINVSIQKEKQKEAFANKKKINKKHDTGFIGVTVQTQKREIPYKSYLMQFYFNGYHVDQKRSVSNPEELALLHDMYSLLYGKTPLKLNFKEDKVRKELKKNKDVLKVIKYKKGDRVGLKLKEGDQLKRVDAIIDQALPDNRYNVMVKTEKDGFRIIKDIYIFDLCQAKLSVKE